MHFDSKPPPSPAAKLKSPLLPCLPSSDPLKRKLNMDTLRLNSAFTTFDSGVKVFLISSILCFVFSVRWTRFCGFQGYFFICKVVARMKSPLLIFVLVWYTFRLYYASYFYLPFYVNWCAPDLFIFVVSRFCRKKRGYLTIYDDKQTHFIILEIKKIWYAMFSAFPLIPTHLLIFIASSHHFLPAFLKQDS